MGVRFSDIPLGEELNQEWRPKRDIGTVAQQLMPWVVWPTVFLLSGTLIDFLQSQWPGSPILWVMRQLGRGILAAVQCILGLVVWCFSGSGTVIKNIPDVITSHQSAVAVPPLISGLFLARLFFRILKQSQITGRAAIGIVSVSALFIAINISAATSSGSVNWLTNTWELIGMFWAK